MKAAIRRGNALVVDLIGDPVPRAGEVLVKTLACGICGSDLHMLHHCEQFLPAMKKAGTTLFDFDTRQDVVFGHEFCAEVIDYGPQTQRTLKPGTRVCAPPLCVTAEGIEGVGYSNRYPGGFGEFMVLQEASLLPVEGGLPSDLAALTEPLSVAAHAVNLARLAGNEVPIVVGCGPIGLATILTLKARGIGPVVASDFSPARRALAEALGADVVVDPAVDSPHKRWLDLAAPADYDPANPLAVLGLGPQPRPCVIFECVGVPGVIRRLMTDAPARSRIVVVGVCMEADTFEPLVGICKELELRFSFGYSGEEFAHTLRQLIDGRLDAGRLITGKVGVEGAAQAFEDLARADHHAKILITFD
ncbi:MAG: zinc-binding dehydrogenase [Rhodocyclaceae bacterium]|jgi:threonine dehydrogenase-like Zn-dependent dehydrogenase|nr:zinc-binding dehydrogenase [Rhodocyclaceae bacterium]